MKFLKIELETNDPSGTRAFYTQRLGLPVVSESVDTLTLQVGWTQLVFRSVAAPVSPYHFAINVPAGTLEVCMHWYGLDYLDTQAPGQTIAEFHDWHARSAYFYDNNGNLLEFITRHDLPSADANMTISDLFQGISEIGLVTSCVFKTIGELHKRFGIERFSKSKPMPDFAALGDDSGLFIISRVNRNWLFTNTPAAVNNTTVTFQLEPAGPIHTIHTNELNSTMGTSHPCTCPLSRQRAESKQLLAA